MKVLIATVLFSLFSFTAFAVECIPHSLELMSGSKKYTVRCTNFAHDTFYKLAIIRCRNSNDPSNGISKGFTIAQPKTEDLSDQMVQVAKSREIISQLKLHVRSNTKITLNYWPCSLVGSTQKINFVQSVVVPRRQ